MEPPKNQLCFKQNFGDSKAAVPLWKTIVFYVPVELKRRPREGPENEGESGRLLYWWAVLSDDLVQFENPDHEQEWLRWSEGEVSDNTVHKDPEVI